MSSAKPSLPAATATEQPTPRLFRFSLLTLLSVMTLAGFTSAIIFSPHWDTDERLLLALWCAGLILGVSVGRFRGNAGVISGGLGAVIGCLVATSLLLERRFPQQQLTAWDGQSITPYLAFIICVGWFAAIFTALAYRAVATGWLERMWFNARVRWLLLGAVASIFSVLIVTQIFQARRWQPAWEVDLRMQRWKLAPVFQISARGDSLFIHHDSADFRTQRTDSLFQLTSRGVVRRDLNGAVDQPHLALSPDGKWLVAGTSCYVSLFDLATGKDVSVWKLKDIETITQLQFNAAGELLVTTHTPRIQRCYVMDVTADPLPQPQLFPFVGMLLLDPTGEVLVKLYEPLDESASWSVDLLQRKDQQLLGQLRDAPSPGLLKIAPGGKALAFGSQVWEFDGAWQELAGRVVGFTPDQRAIVFIQQSGMPRPKWAPDWLLTMPFARHWFKGRFTGELQLVDLQTGKTIAKTARLAELTRPQTAQTGNVVVGVSGSHFRVWNVPQGK